MTDKNLSELTDSELLDEAKKMKSNSVIHALFIGIMIGVITYGVAKNNFGFLALIPLYFVYKIFSNTENNKNNKALENLLKERNLK